MFVLTAVSSINTSRAGSERTLLSVSSGGALAPHSARCRSAACSTFFERDVVSVEKTREQTAAGFDPSLAQFCNHLYQGQVRPLGDQIQNIDRELFQRRNAPAAPLRGGAPLFRYQRCSHFTADATLTSKRSAASRRDAPVSTAVITRSPSHENRPSASQPP